MMVPPASEKSVFSSLILPSAPESVTLALPTAARGGLASPCKHTGAIHHAKLRFIRNRYTLFYWFKEEMRAGRTLFSAMQLRYHGAANAIVKRTLSNSEHIKGRAGNKASVKRRRLTC